jgi:proton translocating ATP synthase F1 alpha subunit
MVFDDLSEHAIAYRQVSLLLRRPPGREAFPGDIFFLHSKLLERAAQLTKTLGGGSLTCLPIIETKLGDISAYIPTNVISITDGQIFLSKQLANKAVRPAIYLDLSVSRVGSKAQYTSMKEVANMIKKDYRLFKDYETMSKIGDVDSRYAAYVNRGLLIKALLNQKLYQSTSFFKEVLSLYAVTKGFIDGMNLEYVELFFGLLFNGNFSHIYLNNKTEYNLFVHFEKQLLLESLLMVVPISAVEPEFISLFDMYMDFFNSELLPKIVVDVNKFYTRRLTLLSTAERTIID